MDRSFSSPASLDPLPPSSCTGMSSYIRTYTLSATYACCAVLCLCKCMMVRALCGVRAMLCMLCRRAFALLCLRFASTHSQPFALPSIASHPLLTLSCTLFLSFLLLSSCMHPLFCYAPHVHLEHQTNSNKLS